MKSVANSFRIGTAAWSIPQAFAHEFTKDGSHLERYARSFNAVEINTSFYKEHQGKTYARWAETVPAEFRFAAKLRKTLTHEQRLDVSQDELREVLAPMMELGEKFEILLVQLPPSLELKMKTATAFFKRLRAQFEAGVVCEPRHKTWFTPEAQKLFSDYGIGRAWVDPEKLTHMPSPKGTPLYLRLHGSPQIYKSNYEKERIEIYASQLRAAKNPLRWCIFDNTTFGFATDNALSLTHMMSSKKDP